MKRGTSLYLDVVCFSAALVVFVEHLREHTKNGFGAFWQTHPFLFTHWNPYGQTAVTVFFVLSGYVIAHVLSTRERALADYTASRLARLYSVAIPALLLATLCNYLITLRYPDAFQVFESGGPWGIALSYLGTPSFANCFWLWPNIELPNVPFWALSFEAAYYIAIALLVFMRGRGRIVGILVLSLMAGPSIVLLAPLWFLGYAIYHLSKRQSVDIRLAIPLWLITLVLLPLCSYLELHFRQHLEFLRTADHGLGALFAAYAAAICFGVNLIAFDALSDRVEPLLAPFGAAIRWAGSMTFALYLFHQPLLSLFTVYSMPDRSSLEQLMLLVGGPFLVVITLGRLCEGAKGTYRNWFMALFACFAPRADESGAGQERSSTPANCPPRAVRLGFHGKGG